jgi:hypothetical protein
MAAKQEKPFGEDLLRSILADGSEKNNEQIGLAASYFGSRVEGKRLQLANQDRRRPVAGIDTLGHHQIEKRNKRILKKRRQSTHTPHHKVKNEKVAMSRRERQRLGLENWDENITYESLLPVHNLWVEYIHRLLGLIDENCHTQTNQFHYTKGSQGEKEEVTVNSSVINTFQTNIVKADLCGALVRGGLEIVLFCFVLSILTNPCVFTTSDFDSVKSIESIAGRNRRIGRKGNRVYHCTCHQVTAFRSQEESKARQR